MAPEFSQWTLPEGVTDQIDKIGGDHIQLKKNPTRFLDRFDDLLTFKIFPLNIEI